MPTWVRVFVIVYVLAILGFVAITEYKTKEEK